MTLHKNFQMMQTSLCRIFNNVEEYIKICDRTKYLALLKSKISWRHQDFKVSWLRYGIRDIKMRPNKLFSSTTKLKCSKQTLLTKR